MNNQVWGRQAKQFLKKEMQQYAITCESLSQKLEKIQVHITPEEVKRKLKRESISAEFWLSSLCAMGVETINLKELKTLKGTL